MMPKQTRQRILLKADDLVYDPVHTISDEWIRFLDFIHRNAVHAAAGIIGQSLESGSSSYLEKLREIYAHGYVEFWNHGYTHLLNGTDKKGRIFHEFSGSGLDSQLHNLRMTQQLAKDKLSLTLRTFGAPGNAVDEDTVKALEQIDEIKVWFFGKPSTKWVLQRFCNLELQTGQPDFQKFESSYDASKEYLVLQLHPNMWDKERFSQFTQTIDFLKKQRVEFVTPYSYYQYMRRMSEK